MAGLTVGDLRVQISTEGAQEAAADLRSVDEAGRAAARGSQQSSTTIRSMADQVAAARWREAEAAEILGRAEQRLQQLRASGSASAQDLASANADLANAQRAQSEASEQAAAAQAQAGDAASRMADQTSDAGAETERAASRSESAFRSMASAAAGLLSAGAVVAYLKNAVMAASDLSETTNAVEQTFGSAAQAIYDFGSTAAESIGQANVTARQGAVTFGTYGKAAGLTGDQLAGFSTSLVTLASDMASFSNTSPEEAIAALGAALRGESDPIEAYGVLLNEATIQQRAMRIGIINTTSQALTPQQRVLAAYAEIMAQTTTQQGDFARTSSGMANGLRVLSARATDTAAAVGEQFLPFVERVIGFLAGPGISAVAGFASVLASLLAPVGMAVDLFTALPGPVQAAIAAVVAFRIAQKLMGDSAAGLGQRLMSPWRGFREEMRLQQALLTGSSRITTTAIGQMGLAMAALGSRVPMIRQMGDAYDRAAAGSGRLAGSLAGVAAAGATAARAGIGSLIGALGGPWGVAITGAVLLLGLWMQQQQRAKQEAQRAAAATDEYADALRKTGGVIDDNVRAMAAKRAEEAGALAAGQRFAVSEREITAAIADRGPALDSVIAKLREFAAANSTEYVDPNSTTGEVETRYNEAGQAALDYANQLQGLAGEVDNAVSQQGRLDAANASVAGSFDVQAAAANAAAQQASAWTTAMTDLADGTKSAEEKVDALAEALLAASGKTISFDEAVQQWNDAIRELGPAFDEAGAAAVRMDGSIDTTTETGSALQSSLFDIRDAYAEMTSATLVAAQGNQLSGEAAAGAALKAAEMRGQVIDLAMAQGVGAAEANNLADRLGLIPRDVVTNIAQPGMLPAIANSIGLTDKIIGIPNDKFITVRSLAPEQIRLMETLGYKITQLPDGSFRVDADVAAAERQLAFAARERTARINAVFTPSGDLRIPGRGTITKQAEGGVVEYYAAGGVRPMSGRRAAIVQSAARTGVERVIGDNPLYDEGFVPLDPQNPQYQAILDEVIMRMRPELLTAPAAVGVPVPVEAGGRGGNRYDIHLHAVQSLPTVRQLRELLHDVEVTYG